MQPCMNYTTKQAFSHWLVGATNLISDEMTIFVNSSFVWKQWVIAKLRMFDIFQLFINMTEELAENQNRFDS